MKKVSDEKRAAIEEIYSQLRNTETTLDDEVNRCNYEIESAMESLQDTVTVYNDLIDELNEAVSGIEDDILEHMESKPEDWQDSEEGQTYAEWIQVFEPHKEHAEDPIDQLFEVTVDLWHGVVEDYQWQI